MRRIRMNRKVRLCMDGDWVRFCYGVWYWNVMEVIGWGLFERDGTAEKDLVWDEVQVGSWVV